MARTASRVESRGKVSQAQGQKVRNIEIRVSSFADAGAEYISSSLSWRKEEVEWNGRGKWG
jgi:hypothetical protein